MGSPISSNNVRTVGVANASELPALERMHIVPNSEEVLIFAHDVTGNEARDEVPSHEEDRNFEK